MPEMNKMPQLEPCDSKWYLSVILTLRLVKQPSEASARVWGNCIGRQWWWCTCCGCWVALEIYGRWVVLYPAQPEWTWFSGFYIPHFSVYTTTAGVKLIFIGNGNGNSLIHSWLSERETNGHRQCIRFFLRHPPKFGVCTYILKTRW